MREETFRFSDERFGDLQMLRYHLDGFEALSLRQKQYIYCLSEATLYGRDITFDQFGKYNLRIRRALEAVYVSETDRESENFKALELYLKKVWFSNGIYHHYGSDKFVPGFSQPYFRDALLNVDSELLGMDENESVSAFINTIFPVIFDPEVLPKRVNKADGVDIIRTSACNYYEGVSQEEVEQFYQKAKDAADTAHPVSHGLNSTLVKADGELKEVVWKLGGKYGKAIEKIVYWLEKATQYCENDEQKRIIGLLIEYYKTGDLSVFDAYSIAWVSECEGRIDFINGFIEVYGDPLGLKASWEGIVHFKDMEATKRTQTISQNAQWFEDHSPEAQQFKKEKVKGVTANVVCAAMLGGDEYPSTAIGINLPNADWIRTEYGSKSVTISNLTHAYSMAAKGNGFLSEFVIDAATLAMIEQYGDQTDNLHTDLHECLGHGSGKLLPGTDSDALKNYGNTIEEARADLFGLYYMGDEKLLELGLLESNEAYKAQYYTYMMNGLMTQLVRINPGKQIEESHMQNRALIARWAVELGTESNVIEIIRRKTADGKAEKSFVSISDYAGLRNIFARQLAEIQRIKSEGDYEAARSLVEKYAIKIDESLHNEILDRYAHLNIAPYKGFLNPVLKPIYNEENEIADIEVDYTEGYAEQMLRYSKEYGTL